MKEDHKDSVCKKCGGIGFSGPKYKQFCALFSAILDEWLEFRCKCCGYIFTEKCNDE